MFLLCLPQARLLRAVLNDPGMCGQHVGFLTSHWCSWLSAGSERDLFLSVSDQPVWWGRRTSRCTAYSWKSAGWAFESFEPGNIDKKISQSAFKMGQTVGAMMHENAFGQFRVLRINRDENVIRDRKRSKTMPFYGFMNTACLTWIGFRHWIIKMVTLEDYFFIELIITDARFNIA